MSRKRLDLLLVSGLAILAVALALAAPDGFVGRGLGGLLLVLVLPGYALMAALLPSASLGQVERGGLALGLSLVVSVLGGFGLAWTPGGLSATSWSLLLGGLTLLAAALAALRRPAAPPLVLTWSAPRVVVFGLALLVLGSAFKVAEAGALAQPRPPFTQLWLLAGQTEATMVRVGLHSAEQQPRSYLVQLRQAERVLARWGPIQVEPGQSWETLASTNGVSNAEPFEVVLFLAEDPSQVYRRASLWVEEPGS